MRLDVSSIQDPRVRTFYSLYWSQHQIMVDFFTRLAEEQFDYRMVDTPERKSDTPRERLAHILYVQLVYLNGVKTGKLEFRRVLFRSHVVGMARNGWTASIGIAGRHGPDYALLRDSKNRY